MTYSDKVWKDSPDHTTPLSAAGLNDWEARIKAETDALSHSKVAKSGDSTGAVRLIPTSAATVPLKLKGAASQSADLLDFFKSDDTKYGAVTSDGRLQMGTGDFTASPNAGSVSEAPVAVCRPIGAGNGHVFHFEVEGRAYYHANKYGLGVVGVDDTNYPYFAIENTTAIDTKMVMQMTGVHGQGCMFKAYSPTETVTPTLTFQSRSHMILETGRKLDNTADTSALLALRAPAGVRVEDFAGTGQGRIEMTRTTTTAAIRAYDATDTGAVDLTVRARQHVIIQPGYKNDTTNDTTGAVYVRTGNSLAVEGFAGDHAGLISLFPISNAATEIRGWNGADANQAHDLYVKARSNLRLKGGIKNDGSIDTSGYILMSAPNGIAIQDTGGTNNILLATYSGGAAKLGFFGTAAAFRPAGVAVTAAGIHAALVTLGLITA